jgi:hypothetical protein
VLDAVVADGGRGLDVETEIDAARALLFGDDDE